MSDDELVSFPSDSGGELDQSAAKIVSLDRRAEEYIEKNKPKNTTDTYAAGWKVWVNYCETLGIPETSNSRGPLIGFIVHLANLGRAATTIDSRISAVMVGLRRRGLEPDAPTRTKVREAFDGLKRKLAEANDKRGRGQAAPMLKGRLRRIADACPDTNAGIRDRALVTMAFRIAARRSEIAHLLITDIAIERRGLMVTIRFGKTGGREVQIPAKLDDPTCAVAAWKAWLDILGETEGPAFRCVHRSGSILKGMSPKAAGEIISRSAERAGIEIRMTGHSARAGLVTEATEAGHQPDIIARTTGHRANSKVLWDYRRVEDGWTNNANVGI